MNCCLLCRSCFTDQHETHETAKHFGTAVSEKFLFIKKSAFDKHRNTIWETIQHSDVWTALLNSWHSAAEPADPTATSSSELMKAAIQAILSSQGLQMQQRKVNPEEKILNAILDRLHRIISSGIELIDCNLSQGILNDVVAGLVLSSLSGHQKKENSEAGESADERNKEIHLDISFLTEHMDETYGKRWHAFLIEGRILSASRPPDQLVALSVMNQSVILWREKRKVMERKQKDVRNVNSDHSKSDILQSVKHKLTKEEQKQSDKKHNW